jgi:hypothetical protein
MGVFLNAQRLQYKEYPVSGGKELDLTETIIGAAIEVHNDWGPGRLFCRFASFHAEKHFRHASGLQWA